MTDRDNSDRVGVLPTQDTVITDSTTSLTYVSPTEFVNLPSEGKFYPLGHPLKDKKDVEIKYMTAKEEDILTSKTLLKKGIAIDRMLESLLVDKKIKLDELLIGDKNALILAARKSGYGPIYDTQVSCPKCEKKSNFSFNLDQIQNKVNTFDPETTKETGNGTFLIKLPRTQSEVEIKPMTGKEEKILSDLKEQRLKEKKPEATSTTQMKLFILSVNGNRTKSEVDVFIDRMPAFDAKFLRQKFKEISPDVEMTQHFTCSQCEYETDIEVPLTTDFFWPE